MRPIVLLLLMWSASAASYVTTDCYNLSEVVREDHARGRRMLRNMIGQARGYLAHPEVRSEALLGAQLQAILNRLARMSELYNDSLSYRCPRLEGGVIPHSFPGVKRSAIAWVNYGLPGVIHLHQQYFFYSPKSRSSTIIHEVSHFAGADDLHYFSSGFSGTARDQSLTTGLKRSGKWSTWNELSGDPTRAARNADNYWWWAMNGFCLPNLDCP